MIEVPIVGFGRIRAGAVVGLFLGGLIVGWTLRGVAIGGSGSLGSRVGAVEGWPPILEVQFLAVEPSSTTGLPCLSLKRPSLVEDATTRIGFSPRLSCG